MMQAKDYFELGLKFHGHKCPAMPLGLRAGAAAMNALGVERSKDKELVLIAETGDDHAAGCFVDGLMTVTGVRMARATLRKHTMVKWRLRSLILRSKKRCVFSLNLNFSARCCSRLLCSNVSKAYRRKIYRQSVVLH